MNAVSPLNLTVERTLDVDSHEMVPVNLRDEIFGATALVEASKTFGIRKHQTKHANQTSMPDKVDEEQQPYGELTSAFDVAKKIDLARA